MTEPLKRRGAIHSLDRFAMSVPDLDEAASFFYSFGLAVGRTEFGLTLRCRGTPHVWAEITQGERKQLTRLIFAAAQEDLPLIAEQLIAANAFDDSGSARCVRGWTPDGLPVEIKAGRKSSPDEKGEFDQGTAFSRTQASFPRSRRPRVEPKRLSHIALFTVDVDMTIAFFREALGIRLSDRSESNVAFMHGAFGSDHHMIALARSSGPGLHHSSWEVGSVDEVGRGAEQMRGAGHGDGWGLGRHVLGSNYFHYVRDPWGSYAEYSAGMDYIAQGVRWEAADHPGEDSFYQWGPPPPEDFVFNHEIEVA